MSRHAKSQFAGAAALTGNGVGVEFGVETELKDEPVLVAVGVTKGVLRSMMLGLDVATVDGLTEAGPWALTPTKEGDGELTAGEKGDGRLDGRTEDGVAENCAGGKLGAGPELGTAGGDEHGAFTVTVESMKTVSIPSAPLVVKADTPPCTEGVVGDGGVVVLPKLTLDDVVVVGGVESGGGDGVGVLVGTIPPKLNVFVGDAEPN